MRTDSHRDAWAIRAPFLAAQQ
ncbi:protein of unknown function [Burkholderia multivorans]